MLRPSKELLLGFVGVGFCTAVLIVHPGVGDRGFVGKPHTTVSIIVLYGILAVILVGSVRQVYQSVTTGGAFLRGKCGSITMEFRTDSWAWTRPIELGPNECLWFRGECTGAPSDLVTFRCALGDPTTVSGSPTLCSEEISVEVAWQAEYLDPPVNRLVPDTGPGEYVLGVHASCAERGLVELKLKWGKSIFKQRKSRS